VSAIDASQKLPGPELKSELARFCLPDANRDASRPLAWMNSICILFLLIGLVGARPASTAVRKPPPIDEIIPTIIEPLTPPTAADQPQSQERPDQDKPDTPQVVVVTPDSPAINFSVPTIGNLVVPNALAAPPPVAPMKAIAPLRSQPRTIENTGQGGERPSPAYPRIALEQGLQGSVTLSIAVDDAGIITAVSVKASSGHPLLDRSALDFVKKHWIIPPAGGNQLYETTITYLITR
jgi:protein TonB